MAVAGPEVEPGAKTAEAARTRRGPGRRGAVLRLALMAVPVAFFGLFFAYPVTAIVGRGLKAGGDWQFGRIGDVLARPDILDVLWFTTWQALASTALTLLIALPGAYVFARFDFPGKQLLRAVVTVPFVLPTVVVGTAFLALLGRGGLLDEVWGVRLDTTVWAILLAHVFFNYAVVVRTVGGLWSQAGPPAGGGRPGARRRTVRRLPPGDAARARPGRRRRRADGVPLHLHLLRCRADPRRTRVLHPGGGDLPADRATAGPADGRRADPGPARRGRRDPRRARRDRTPPGAGAEAGRPCPDLPQAARSRTVGAARRCPAYRAAADPAAAGGAGGALLRRSRMDPAGTASATTGPSSRPGPAGPPPSWSRRWRPSATPCGTRSSRRSSLSSSAASRRRP